MRFTRWVIAAALLLAAAPAVAQSTAPADPLQGVWVSQANYPATLRGELTVTRDGAHWRATIGDRSTQFDVANNQVRFDFAGHGGFRGALRRGVIEGFWLQPVARTEGRTDPTATQQGFASPLRIAPSGRNTWRAQVTPLEGPFTLYLHLFRADDGAEVGRLAWEPRRPGQTLLMFILPLVALGVVGVGVLTWVMITRLKNASGELADREAESRYQAMHDSLSGLPNRPNFVARLQDNLDGLIQARNNSRVVVAYIDVDRFKDVNDTLGHQAGDALIMAVAKRLRTVIAPEDFLSRFGGDEFAVLRRATSPHAAAELSERLKHAFEEAFDVYGQHIRMTASIGIATAPDHGASPQELMRHADIALYQGKNQGRDRAMIFCAEMAAEVEHRREIELELHAAMTNGELTLHYQPLVACADSKVTGVEALLRWKHKVKGDISPAIFIPIAEEAGMMPELGAFVLDRAFGDSKQWPDLEVSINLSPVQFRHVDLVDLLERLVAAHAVDPRRIVLEVTEGVLMESTERNRHILDAIRAMGFKIALDDFGTGYSSLRYLCDFRFDKIKIDRAFVTGIHERKRAMTIIQSVVTLGRGLGMEIVAEGVETEAEASVMRLVGVTELQGFFFSHAVPSATIATLVAALGAAPTPEQAAPAADLRNQRRS
mgnify:CR=1 FL=1